MLLTWNQDLSRFFFCGFCEILVHSQSFMALEHWRSDCYPNVSGSTFLFLPSLREPLDFIYPKRSFRPTYTHKSSTMKCLISFSIPIVFLSRTSRPLSVGIRMLVCNLFRYPEPPLFNHSLDFPSKAARSTITIKLPISTQIPHVL